MGVPIYTQSEDKGMTAFQERGGKGGINIYIESKRRGSKRRPAGMLTLGVS